MAEIIYTETETHRPANLDKELSQVSLDRKYTLWQDANKVGITCSVLRSGRATRGTDKRWYKWGTVQAYGFLRNKTGNVVAYQVDRADSLRATDLWRNRKPIHAFDTLDGDGINLTITERFQRAMRETFNIKDMYDIYPLAREYDITKYAGLPSNLLPAMRQSNPRDAAVVLFGKTRVNNDWPLAMLKTDPYFISMAHQFRGYGKDTDVLGFMKNNDFDDEMLDAYSGNTPKIRPFLPRLHPDSYTHLLSNRMDNVDLRRINYFAGVGAPIEYYLKRAENKEPMHNWNELLSSLTGTNF